LEIKETPISVFFNFPESENLKLGDDLGSPRVKALKATTLKLGEALQGQSFPKCKAGNVV
jgi:hypothetical protein